MSQSSTTNSLLIDDVLLDRLLDQAAASARRRKNHNFHATDSHPCQRLLNAILEDSYIQPHRHLDPAKDETLVMLRGRLGILFFDAAGAITERLIIDAMGESCGLTIPSGTYHTLVPLAPRNVIFETKAGPYVPHRPDELAPFAPPEGDRWCSAQLGAWKRLFDDADF